MMVVGNNNTMIIKWMLGLAGIAFLGVVAFIGNSFSQELRAIQLELREIQKDGNASKERLSVVETIIDNIRDDVTEIKQDVKDTQQSIWIMDNNLDEIKQMIVEAELRSMRTVRDGRSTSADNR